MFAITRPTVNLLEGWGNLPDGPALCWAPPLSKTLSSTSSGRVATCATTFTGVSGKFSDQGGWPVSALSHFQSNAHTGTPRKNPRQNLRPSGGQSLAPAIFWCKICPPWDVIEEGNLRSRRTLRPRRMAKANGPA